MMSGKRKRPFWFMLIAGLLIIAGGTSVYFAMLASRHDTACLASAPAHTTANDSDMARQLQAVLDEYSQTHNHVGLQATVILADGTQWQGVSGYANHAKACPLTLDHHLYIGSVSKTFTAALVMQQIEAGLIRLDDPIETWFTHPNGNQITVEMLLRHTNGLPNYTEDTSFLLAYFGRPEKEWQPEELFAVIQDKPLNFEPGSQHLYSNANFIALGIILEQVTGKSYGALLQDAVHDLGLERIYYPAYSQNLILANGYDETLFNLGKRNLTAFRMSFVSGAFSAGGIAAAAPDAANFFHTMFNGAWLTDETIAQMMTTMDAPDEDGPLQKGYGLGVRNLGIDEESLYGHTGTIPGYSGIAMHNPQHGFTMVVLSNVSTIEQTMLFAALQEVVLQPLRTKS